MQAEPFEAVRSEFAPGCRAFSIENRSERSNSTMKAIRTAAIVVYAGIARALDGPGLSPDDARKRRAELVLPIHRIAGAAAGK